jgi:sulfonate transport system ATP-binding protein
MKNLLQISSLEKEYTIAGQSVEVLKDINLDVADREFVSIVGVSGCGKSTLLKTIAGIETATRGNVVLDGKIITGPSEQCGIVFQEPRLFPWSTVTQNIDFGIPEAVNRPGRKKRVTGYIKLAGLEDFAGALPNQLSGGMQQRVSIARALAGEPELLLLDEPFGALDALTRIQMQLEILRIWEAERRTMILVTHDIDEAIFLGDRVVVMSKRPGTIQEIIPVYLSRPRNRTDQDFQTLRKRVYGRFFDNSEISADYYI